MQTKRKHLILDIVDGKCQVLKYQSYFHLISMYLLIFSQTPNIMCLTVKSVVDTVDNVIWGRCLCYETALVLLQYFSLTGRKSWDLVKVSNSCVWSV